MADWLLNPITKRYIKRGSKTFKTLIKTGVISEEEIKANKQMKEESSDFDYETDDLLHYSDLDSEPEEQERVKPKKNKKIKTMPNTEDLNYEDIDNMTDEQVNKFYEMLKYQIRK